MGGQGSENRRRVQLTKNTVEKSHALDMSHLRKRIYIGSTGTFTWTRTSGRKSSVAFYITGGVNGPTVHVHYRWADKEDVNIPIRLESPPTQFNGRRWWFVCPLIVHGVACTRRVAKLYLAPGAKYFGCRTCHNLTYRSSQEAHQTERSFARMGFGADVAKWWNRVHRSR